MEEIITMEKIMELLLGYKYYTKEQINYVYHKLNNNVKEAEYYLKICEEQNKKINDAYNKLQNS